MSEIGQQDNVFAAAVAYVGQTAFAREIKKSQQAVSKMVKKGKCPAEYVIPLERVTCGKFPRHLIRPDIFGPQKQAP